MPKPLPVEVEVVSARRWAKLERSLFARWDEEQHGQRPRVELPVARSSARRWAVSGVALAALVASIVCLATWHDSGEQVGFDRTSRIATGVNSSHLSLEGLKLDVQPESAVVLGSPSEHGLLIVLDRGKIICDVASRSAAAPLVIQAGSVQIKVIGTRFSVTRTGEKARVAVEHGVVEVAAEGRVVRVGAGQVWPTEAQVVAPSASATPSEAPSSVDEAPLNDAPRKSPPSVGTGAGGGALSARRAVHGEPAQARFEAAAALERSDPARAVELYRGLESGTDSWAQHALYAHGRLEAARGNGPQARELLERYVNRYPRGPNSADARSLLARLR